MKLKLCSLFSLAIAFAATPLRATTYYWKPGATLGDYGTLSNWSTEGLSGADAAALPGSGDALYYKGDYAFDLGGNTYEIGGWSASADSGARRTLSVVNGTLDNKGDWKPYKMTMTIGGGGTFVHSGGSFLPGQDSTSITYVNVESGGTFTLTGACNPLNLHFNVASGGTFNFSPSYWGLPNKACASGIQLNNGGTMNMVNGMSLGNGAASGGAITVSQNAGTLNLAGTLNGAPPAGKRTAVSLSFRFAGGTVNVTDDTTFANCAAVTLAGPTTWNVASGKTVSFSGSVTSFGFDSTGFSPGDTILTTADAPLRAKVLADLTALGASVEESGNDVKLAAAGPRTTPYTFYWVNNTAASWANWNDASSWTDAGGNAMTEAPTAIDTVASFDETKVMMYADLGGATNEIAALNVTHGAWWKYDQFDVTNGALVVTGTANFESPTPFNIWSGATLSIGNLTFSDKSTGENNMDSFVVHDGGRLEFLGNFQPRQMNITVEEGGYYLYGASATLQNCNYGRFHNIYNRGTMAWPGGFYRQNNAWSVHPCIRQLAGEWILGDRLEMPNNIHGRIELAGGTLRATGDVSFRLYGSGASADNAWAKFMPQADITLDVASGRTLDMARSDSRYVPFAYEPGSDGTNYTKITRTGLGTLLLADVPYSLDLQSGTTTFSGNSRTAMGTLNVAAGQSFTIANANTTLATLEDNAGTITIAKPGLAVNAVGAGATLSGAFAFNTASFAEGDTVVTTPDATLRAAIKSAAEVAFESAGVAIIESGDALTIGASTYIFDSTSVTDLNDPAGWQNGLPAAGRDVIVSGAGVNAIVAADLTNVWNSITVQDGASLTIAADGMTLPSLVLRGDSSLDVNGDFTLGSLSTLLGEGVYPTLAVASGATLTVPANAKFSNVHLVLADGSTLSEASGGELVFGYASAGETARFTMFATNATIRAATGNLALAFGCPASGGTVAMDAAIELVDVALPEIYGLVLGENNPTNAPFAVLADGTGLSYHNKFKVAGAATLQVANATLRNAGGNPDYDIFHIAEAGQVVAGENGNVQHHVAGGANQATAVRGHSDTDRPGVVLAGGSFYPWTLYHSSAQSSPGGSDGNRTMSVTADSFYDLANDDFYGRSETAFNLLKSVDIEEDATLYLRRREDASWGSSDRDFMVAATPIAGAGNLFVTNTTPASSYSVTFQGGMNTATGTLAGDENSLICFADGANWAGTVVANGNVALTNGAKAASVTFGALRLESGTFPIRLWHDAENGYTVDHLNITGSGIDCAGGRFELVPQGDYTLPRGTSVYLGRWAKAAVPSGAVRFKGAVMQFLAADVDGEPSRSDVYLRALSGFIITIR